MEVLKVSERSDGVKMVFIPKRSEIKKGDLVLVTNNLELINKFKINKMENEKNGEERR